MEALLSEDGLRAPGLGWKAGLALIVLGLLVVPMADGGRRSLAAEMPESEIHVESGKNRSDADIRYQMDPEFVRYFDQRGVQEVKAAMRILNSNDLLSRSTLSGESLHRLGR